VGEGGTGREMKGMKYSSRKRVEEGPGNGPVCGMVKSRGRKSLFLREGLHFFFFLSLNERPADLSLKG
jgi:hypothetical protein